MSRPSSALSAVGGLNVVAPEPAATVTSRDGADSAIVMAYEKRAMDEEI